MSYTYSYNKMFISFFILILHQVIMGQIVDRVGNQSLKQWVDCRGKQCDEVSRSRQRMALLLSVEVSKNNFHLVDFDNPGGIKPSDAESLENCILLSDEQIDVLLENALTGNRKGMKWQNSDRRTKRGIRGGAFNRWKMPIVWKFSGEQANKEREIIRAAFKHWEDNTCVRFQEVGVNEEVIGHHILLTNSGNGCYSYVGQVNLFPQPINLQPECLNDFGVPVHEIGHALGLWHEHQRPDRDDYINIRRDNLKFFLSQYVKREIDADVQLPYDHSSVMHYGPKIGSLHQSKNTIESINPLLQQNMGQRVGLSHLNSKLINYAYCNASCSSDVSCLNDGYQDPNNCNICKCPDGFSGRRCNEVQSYKKENCGGILMASESSQFIESPGYNGLEYYQNGQQCNWLIKAPADYKIEVEFVSHFGLYSHSQGQCYHWVEIKKGPLYSHAGPRFCGFIRPEGVLDLQRKSTPVREISITMRSDYTVLWHAMRRGFKLRYKSIRISTMRTTPTIPQTSIPTTVTQSPDIHFDCSKTDVVFLIDSSGSVGKDNWAKVLNFIADYVEKPDVNGLQRFAVISFGTSSTLNIKLSDKFKSRRERRNEIMSIEYKNQWTNTASSIQLATDMMNSESRPETKKVAILITNGPSNTADEADYRRRELLRVARTSRRYGIQYIALGIGREASASELYSIVGYKGKTIYLWSYDKLVESRTYDEIMQFSCKRISMKPSEETSTTTTTTTPSTTTTARSTRPTTTEMGKTTSQKELILFYCDFEKDANLCGMIQSKRDEFDWTRTNKATPSVPTGPDYAARGRYYIFIEASNPRKFGDKAILEIEHKIHYSGPACIGFRYHMFGFHVNELNVSNRYAGKEVNLWRRSGPYGNMWREARINVDIRYKDKILITAIRGKEYSGDIAIDVVKIISGTC